MCLVAWMMTNCWLKLLSSLGKGINLYSTCLCCKSLLLIHKLVLVTVLISNYTRLCTVVMAPECPFLINVVISYSVRNWHAQPMLWPVDPLILMNDQQGSSAILVITSTAHHCSTVLLVFGGMAVVCIRPKSAKFMKRIPDHDVTQSVKFFTSILLIAITFSKQALSRKWQNCLDARLSLLCRVPSVMVESLKTTSLRWISLLC